jgi:hypothetical protein
VPCAVLLQRWETKLSEDSSPYCRGFQWSGLVWLGFLPVVLAFCCLDLVRVAFGSLICRFVCFRFVAKPCCDLLSLALCHLHHNHHHQSSAPLQIVLLQILTSGQGNICSSNIILKTWVSAMTTWRQPFLVVHHTSPPTRVESTIRIPTLETITLSLKYARTIALALKYARAITFLLKYARTSCLPSAS